jgi:tricorn protease
MPNPGDIFIVDAAPKPPIELPRFQVRLGDWQFTANPREEWKQLLADAWRLQRDHFYDKDVKGVDWPAMRRKYEALLPRVSDRAELADLMAQMIAELSTLHSRVDPGDVRKAEENILPATLGAMLVRTAEGARIKRILQGDPELVHERSPLARAEVNAKEGDTIVSVDGRLVKDAPDISELLRDKAGKQALLTLRSAEGKSRQVIVKPMSANDTDALRLADWQWQRRKRVDEVSKFRYGYVHLRAMGRNDVATFAREFYPVADREGLIIDVRNNWGGNIDSIVIEKLMRRAWSYWQTRDGNRYWNQQNAFRGPIVVLANERTYSDGETFAEGVKRLGLATVIGKRTSGAGVWLSDRNLLADNGIARAAETGQMGLEGSWLIEGVGVAPDVEVDNPPNATFNGADAQLDAAIRLLDEKLAAKPMPQPPAISYPRVQR